MKRIATLLVLALTVTAGLGARLASQAGSSAAQAKPWPPGLLSVAKESPALSPEAEMKTFYMPPGYHVELVASEPLVEDPILIDWDPNGRMWVIELLGYMQDLPATNERAPVGRISVLEDTNRDGKMDKKTVFLDGLVLPRALKVLDKGVLVAEPPHLWLAKDTNGDLKSDSKELVCDCYGSELGNVEHNQNGLTWAMDNWMYTSEGDTYFRFKDGKIETRRTLSRGQWGASQDDFGYVYRNSNSSALHIDLLPTPYYARNPNLVRMRGSFEFMGDQDELNATFPVRPNKGVNRGYQTGQLRADGTLATYTAVNSPTVYRGDRLPAELRGNVFVAEPSGNLVSRIIVGDDGASIRGRKAYPNAEFLASTDERFRPVYLSSAPDGTLYVVDIYHGIIQQKGFITEYLRDHIVENKLEAPIHMGRIFRIVHDTTRRDGPPALGSETPAQLVTRLSHPNGWWRDTAQRLLIERGATSVAGELRRLAETAPDPRTRLHAMWTLDGLDRIEPATVTKALEDKSRDVRAGALRIAERWLTEPNAAVQAAVLRRLDDADWAVRQQLAASLGTLPKGPRETAVSALLERRGDDPIIMDAALSGLRGGEAAALDLVLQNPATSVAREAAITMLTATIVRSAQDAAIQTIFAKAAEPARPDWQRAALLRGAEVSLLGAAAPGNPAGRGNRAGGAGRGGDPTAPGGRAGPGGAPAFPREGGAGAGAGGGAARGGAAAVAGEDAPAAGARGGGRGGGGNLLRLNREPAPLTTLASTGGNMGTRATALLARIEWPGKPGASAPITPLTPAEQQRFVAGQTIYEGICQACHQDDGRGKEKMAPSLVGSALATGQASNAIRILLGGKEGPVGLMPPLGQTFTDDQVAAVLTYIRRQWGNAASAVDAPAVKDIRAAVAGRTRPWTNEELAALAGGGRGGGF